MGDILTFPDIKRPPHGRPSSRRPRRRGGDRERELALEHEVFELREIIATLACENISLRMRAGELR